VPISADELQRRAAAFPWHEWSEEKLKPGFEQLYTDLVVRTGTTAAKALGGKWTNGVPFASRFMTTYVGERIVQLEETTKADVSKLIVRVLDEAEGLSTQELADLIGESVRDKFADYQQYRALRIARTEPSIAFNHGAVLGAAQTGVEQFLVHDGEDSDEACKQANGQIWSTQQCLDNPIEHPNCERAFSPVQAEEAA
jgi:hypothetical protein